ncbi:Protein kinase C delta type [Mycena kentingensis (nom. inval.)]|nr:Protein kinase C delta type [Mycena kentingensis (nom. inval.)]
MRKRYRRKSAFLWLSRSPRTRTCSAFVREETFAAVRQAGGATAIVMDLYPASLNQMQGVYPPEVLWVPLYATICVQITGGLMHLHELGIVYRDIKPDNFVLDKKWTLPHRRLRAQLPIHHPHGK